MAEGTSATSGAGTSGSFRPERASTSTVRSRATAGQADTTRETMSGAATITLAAREAATPTRKANHADQRERLTVPEGQCGNQDHAVYGQRQEAARNAGCPASWASSRMWSYDATAAIPVTATVPAIDVKRRGLIGHPRPAAPNGKGRNCPEGYPGGWGTAPPCRLPAGRHHAPPGTGTAAAAGWGCPWV